MDSLSFTFLAYAAWCLARLTTRGRPLSRPALALVAGGLMMALDVVIDPLAVRGDQWFLGRIFFYPEPGLYFGVPLSNFAGWVIVGAAGVALYLWLAGDGRGADPRAGTGLYYAVLLFNLVVTAWIGHWWLATVGTLLHVALAVVLWQVARRTLGRVTFGTRGVETSMRVEW
jgi:putative membrane protein